MVLTTLQSNTKLFLENMLTWGAYFASVSIALMPILQATAFILAAMVSTATLLKVCLEIIEKIKSIRNASNNKEG